LKGLAARLKPDLYVVLIVAVMVLATVVPVRGEAAVVVGWATKLGIGLVFFLHGARLSREAVARGLTHWRLHLLVLATTFGLFPFLGLGLAALPAWITPPALAPGIVLLCCLPSTVQSSIGFTAIARGDVAAAVASATASNLLGVILTPVLAALTLHAAGGGLSLQSVQAIALQLLAPFAAGQLLSAWVGPFVVRHAKILGWTDRGAILLVVYSAFSAAVAAGLWREVSGLDLARLLILCALLLAVVLVATRLAARALGFNKADEIAIVFCGSKKSLASGAPMASVLFPAALVGPMILPLMIFHQFQLMACAVIAQAYARRPDEPAV
jgi:sodium/bile acid cotransporter 7